MVSQSLHVESYADACNPVAEATVELLELIISVATAYIA